MYTFARCSGKPRFFHTYILGALQAAPYLLLVHNPLHGGGAVVGRHGFTWRRAPRERARSLIRVVSQRRAVWTIRRKEMKCSDKAVTKFITRVDVK